MKFNRVLKQLTEGKKIKCSACGNDMEREDSNTMACKNCGKLKAIK